MYFGHLRALEQAANTSLTSWTCQVAVAWLFTHAGHDTFLPWFVYSLRLSPRFVLHQFPGSSAITGSVQPLCVSSGWCRAGSAQEVWWSFFSLRLPAASGNELVRESYTKCSGATERSAESGDRSSGGFTAMSHAHRSIVFVKILISSERTQWKKDKEKCASTIPLIVFYLTTLSV